MVPGMSAVSLFVVHHPGAYVTERREAAGEERTRKEHLFVQRGNPSGAGGTMIIWVHVKPNLVSVLPDDAVSLSQSACQTVEATQSAPPVCDLHSGSSTF